MILNHFIKKWSLLEKRQTLMEILKKMNFGFSKIEDIFYDTCKLRNVDSIDMIAKVIYDESYLTKEERIEKAKQSHPQFFNNQNARQKDILDSILKVYKNTNFKSLNFDNEFWDVPEIKKHGSVTEIKSIFGGKLNQIADRLQEILYDQEI